MDMESVSDGDPIAELLNRDSGSEVPDEMEAEDDDESSGDDASCAAPDDGQNSEIDEAVADDCEEDDEIDVRSVATSANSDKEDEEEERHVEVGDDEAHSMEIPLAAVSRGWKPLNGRRVVLQKRGVPILDEATEQNSARTTGDAPAPTLRRLVRKQPEPAACAASARRNGNPAGQASVDVGVARAAYRDEKHLCRGPSCVYNL